MIALLTTDIALKAFLESLFAEWELPVVSSDEASLLVVDLDSVPSYVKGKKTVTLSYNIFNRPDLVRPFLQEDLRALCRERLEPDFICQPEVAKTLESGESATSGCVLRLAEDGVWYGEAHIALLPSEMRLFTLLFENRGKCVPTEACQKACRTRGEGKKEALDGKEGNSAAVAVAALRKKLDHRFGMRFIVSHRGKGYSLVLPRDTVE